MKEVTRVHIAKVAYDIEVGAKKELEKYINKLELYAADSEILEDIEIRITELLSERGVQRGGVITAEDVMAVRSQLGEPKDFAEDEGPAAEAIEQVVESRRRLYRDTEGAVLGGVLSGLAKYFDLNPLWPRLLFIILFFGSFGTAFIVYVVLWLAVPAARTAAEKLELEGKPVTLESIRARAELGEQPTQGATSESLKKLMLFLAGLAGSIVALGAIITTAVVVFGLYLPREGQFASYLSGDYEWIAQMALGAFVVSGLMLAALGVLLSYAAFSRQFNKKFGIATVVIILVGLMSFGAGVATVAAGVEYERQGLERAIERQEVRLGDDFANVKQLVAAAHAVRSGHYGSGEMTIEYVVDPGEPRYVLSALPGVGVDVNVQDEQARVSLKSSGKQNLAYGRISMPRLMIYGPELASIEVHQGELRYTAGHDGQAELAVDTLDTTRFSAYGKYTKVAVKGGGSVSLDSSTVSELLVEQQAYGDVVAGVVRVLNVVQPEVCPAGYGSPASRVMVKGVSSGEMTYNGSVQQAKSLIKECGVVTVGQDAEGYSVQ